MKVRRDEDGRRGSVRKHMHTTEYLKEKKIMKNTNSTYKSITAAFLAITLAGCSSTASASSAASSSNGVNIDLANPEKLDCDMISSLIDEDGRVTVKGFYDDVVELSAQDRAQLARAPFDLDEYKEFLDIKEVKGEKGYSTLERTGIHYSVS